MSQLLEGNWLRVTLEHQRSYCIKRARKSGVDEFPLLLVNYLAIIRTIHGEQRSQTTSRANCRVATKTQTYAARILVQPSLFRQVTKGEIEELYRMYLQQFPAATFNKEKFITACSERSFRSKGRNEWNKQIRKNKPTRIFRVLGYCLRCDCTLFIAHIKGFQCITNHFCSSQ